MAKAMAAATVIDVAWKEGPTDGLGATIGAFWAAKEAKRLGVPMTAIPLVQEIGKYNKVDCRSEAEMLMALRRSK